MKSVVRPFQFSCSVKNHLCASSSRTNCDKCQNGINYKLAGKWSHIKSKIHKKNENKSDLERIHFTIYLCQKLRIESNNDIERIEKKYKSLTGSFSRFKVGDIIVKKPINPCFDYAFYKIRRNVNRFTNKHFYILTYSIILDEIEPITELELNDENSPITSLHIGLTKLIKGSMSIHIHELNENRDYKLYNKNKIYRNEVCTCDNCCFFEE